MSTLNAYTVNNPSIQNSYISTGYVNWVGDIYDNDVRAPTTGSAGSGEISEGWVAPNQISLSSSSNILVASSDTPSGFTFKNEGIYEYL